MITVDQCFLKLMPEHNYSQLGPLKDFLDTCEFSWKPYFYIYDSENNPIPSGFYDDPLIRKVKNIFGGYFSFYKVPARTVYRWHKDYKSKCCFNLVFKKYHSHTLFSTDCPYDQVDHIEELEYEPNQWYLFNTQIKHMVVNLDAEDRYLVTYRFRDENVTFETVKDWYLKYCQKNSP